MKLTIAETEEKNTHVMILLAWKVSVCSYTTSCENNIGVGGWKAVPVSRNVRKYNSSDNQVVQVWTC